MQPCLTTSVQQSDLDQSSLKFQPPLTGSVLSGKPVNFAETSSSWSGKWNYRHLTRLSYREGLRYRVPSVCWGLVKTQKVAALFMISSSKRALGITLPVKRRWLDQISQISAGTWRNHCRVEQKLTDVSWVRVREPPRTTEGRCWGEAEAVVWPDMLMEWTSELDLRRGTCMASYQRRCPWLTLDCRQVNGWGFFSPLTCLIKPIMFGKLYHHHLKD